MDNTSHASRQIEQRSDWRAVADQYVGPTDMQQTMTDLRTLRELDLLPPSVLTPEPAARYGRDRAQRRLY